MSKRVSAANPESGDVGAETGGARVIYFYRSEAMPLFLLDFYAKSGKTDLDAHDKKQLRNAVKTITERFAV